MSESLLRVEDLSIRIGSRVLLNEVSFELRPGECLTLLGESGAGKSLLAQAIMGNLPRVLAARGRIHIGSAESSADDGPARRPLWGRTLAMLPQEPSQALSPLMKIRSQLAEVHRWVRGLGRDDALKQADDGLKDAGLAAATAQYPWQLSGGMAQRAAACMAQAGGARILLADEPTKGLDRHWSDRVIESFRALRKAGGCVVVITHDLRVARALGGKLIVLRRGEVVEQGETGLVLNAPTQAFTRQLLAAEPARWAVPAVSAPGAEVLHAAGLSKRFGARTLFRDLDLSLNRRQRLVLQGSSGVGKSTLGNILLGLMQPDTGLVRRNPQLPAHAFQKLYQDPVASFAPTVPLRCLLEDVRRRHGGSRESLQAHLERLGIPDDLLERRASEVSGGELQRVAMARALMVRPALLFADEPTSRLDYLTQQDAIRLLLESVETSDAALILVTHDEDIAARLATQTLQFDESGIRQRDQGVAPLGALPGSNLSNRPSVLSVST